MSFFSKLTKEFDELKAKFTDDDKPKDEKPKDDKPKDDKPAADQTGTRGASDSYYGGGEAPSQQAPPSGPPPPSQSPYQQPPANAPSPSPYAPPGQAPSPYGAPPGQAPSPYGAPPGGAPSPYAPPGGAPSPYGAPPGQAAPSPYGGPNTSDPIVVVGDKNAVLALRGHQLTGLGHAHVGFDLESLVGPQREHSSWRHLATLTSPVTTSALLAEVLFEFGTESLSKAVSIAV